MLTFTLMLLSMTPSAHGARLLLGAEQPHFVQLAPQEGEQAATRVSAAQLRADLEALRREKPGLGGGISLVAGGGGVALSSGLYMLMGFVGSSGAINSAFVVLGVVGLSIGLPLAFIGVWILVSRIDQRARIDEEMERLRLQLKDAPIATFGAPAASYVLARF